MARARSQLAVQPHGPLEPGSLVDGLRVERVLSVGAGGCTLCEVSAPDGARLALKLLGDSVSDAESKQRAIWLTRVRASISHPNLVPLVKAGEHDGRLYLVSELRGARTLADRLGDGPLETGDALRLIAGVAGALETALAHRLVHAELTPQAILLGEEEPATALLTDFGIGRVGPGPEKLRVDVEGIDYRSPEEIRGAPLKPESNAYSLACVLFECLTGTPPYPYERPLLTLHAQLVEPPPRPSSLREDLPSGLDDVFARAMAKDPDRRLGPTAIVREAAEALGVTVEIPLIAAPAQQKRRALRPKLVAPTRPRQRGRPKQRTSPPARRGGPDAAPHKPAGDSKPPRAAKPAPPKPAPAKPARPASAPAAAKPARGSKRPRPAKPAHSAQPPRRRPPRRPSHDVPKRRRRPRSGSLPAIALALFALVASGVGGFALGSPDSATEPPVAVPVQPPGAAAKLARAEYVRSVSPVIDRLSARRAAARRRLRRARRPDGQADAARSLVKAYATARRALSTEPPASLDAADLRARLRGAERAYRRLAAAARSENDRAWKSASGVAVEQERRFERSLSALTTT
jgi:serine/threonine kinase PknH